MARIPRSHQDDKSRTRNFATPVTRCHLCSSRGGLIACAFLAQELAAMAFSLGRTAEFASLSHLSASRSQNVWSSSSGSMARVGGNVRLYVSIQ
jgi:hypothetical protein